MALCTHRNYISGDNASMIDTAYCVYLKEQELIEAKTGCFCRPTFVVGAYNGVRIALTLMAENDIHTPEQFMTLFERALDDPKSMFERLQRMRGFFVQDEESEG